MHVILHVNIYYCYLKVVSGALFISFPLRLLFSEKKNSIDALNFNPWIFFVYFLFGE